VLHRTQGGVSAPCARWTPWLVVSAGSPVCAVTAERLSLRGAASCVLATQPVTPRASSADVHALQAKARQSPKRIFLDLVGGDPLGGSPGRAPSAASLTAADVRIRLLEQALQEERQEARALWVHLKAQQLSVQVDYISGYECDGRQCCALLHGI